MKVSIVGDSIVRGLSGLVKNEHADVLSPNSDLPLFFPLIKNSINRGNNVTVVVGRTNNTAVESPLFLSALADTAAQNPVHPIMIVQTPQR